MIAFGAGCTTELQPGSVQRCAIGAWAESPATLETLEGKVGRTMDLHRIFVRWDEPLDGADVRWTLSQRRTPIIDWSGRRTDGTLVLWNQVADPAETSVQQRLAQAARTLRDLQQPVLLVYHSGANDDTEFGSPSDLVAAWRQLHAVFEEQGARNVQLVWALTAGAFPVEADAWFPGDDVVDWIGATGVNWYTGRSDSPWRSFAAIFVSFHAWGSHHPQPLLVLQFASGEHPTEPDDGPRSKATWIRQAHQTLEGWPQVQGAIWWHGHGPDSIRDWNVDSSPSALRAFQEIATDPYFDVTGNRPR